MRLFPPAAAQGEQGEGRQAEGGCGGLGDVVSGGLSYNVYRKSGLYLIRDIREYKEKV